MPRDPDIERLQVFTRVYTGRTTGVRCEERSSCQNTEIEPLQRCSHDAITFSGKERAAWNSLLRNSIE